MAKKFKFPLQRVLEYRRQLEDEAMMKVAKTLAAHQDQQALVNDLREKLELHYASVYSSGEVDQNMLWLGQRYRKRLKEDIAKSQRRLMDLGQLLAKVRLELMECSRDKKLLEKLKSNQEIQYKKEINLQEQRESDEMATIRYQFGAV